jgi:5-methylcytosine-specific restriction endonuclease McrA
LRNTLRAIEYLGGECERCGYDEHPAALEFHHYSDDKNMTLGTVANKSWKKTVKPELENCSLLCSNCHRIEHSNRYDEDFVEAVRKDGRLD